MRSLKSASLIAVSFLRIKGASCSGARWYSLICTTGRTETVSFDGNGGVSFVSANGMDGDADGRRLHRSLRRSLEADGEFQPSQAVPAIPWTEDRSLHDELVDGGFFLEADSTSGNSSLQQTNNPEADGSVPPNGTKHRVRPCLCHPSNVDPDYFGPNETIPDLYLCPEASDYCGIPFQGDGPIGCFSISVQQVVARNAWPLILLWYFGMAVICCCTVHGNTSWDYFATFWDRNRNAERASRLLAQNGPGPAPPDSYWNWWGWQRHRFEQNLLAQAQWVWRHEEYARMQQRREQGLPPPRYEIKTKRFFRSQESERHTTDDTSSHHLHDDDDSLNEPNCTICFVPLEDGDIVGDLPCQHVFHKSCIKSWCTRQNRCPLCSIPIAKRREDSRS